MSVAFCNLGSPSVCPVVFFFSPSGTGDPGRSPLGPLQVRKSTEVLHSKRFLIHHQQRLVFEVCQHPEVLFGIGGSFLTRWSRNSRSDFAFGSLRRIGLGKVDRFQMADQAVEQAIQSHRHGPHTADTLATAVGC